MPTTFRVALEEFLVHRVQSTYIANALKPKEIFTRRYAGLRRRLEGYTVSAIFHLIVLMLLATITLSRGGEGFGIGTRPEGAQVSFDERDESIEDADLEDMVQDVDVTPLEVERIEQRPVTLPELATYSTPRPSSERLSKIQTRFTPTGGVGGLSGQFGNFIFGLRKTGLDVALVIDATNSMQHVIDDIKARASALVGRIQSLVPVARVGAVAFRDRGDEFLVKTRDLTFHSSKIQDWLNKLEAAGGGDYPEAVREGLEEAIDGLTWRTRSKRVIIVIGSSPPHKEDIGPIRALSREFRDAGGVVSAIDVTRRMHEQYQRKISKWLHGEEPSEISPMPEFYGEVRAAFRMIADNGGGDLAQLGSDAELTQQILFFAFGSRWEKEVSRYASDNG